ncbi:MAG: NAD-binding protein [Gammaproteobacteria bacterium]|nr:NAD-binding protein [Gammaproteobacteria bacterium]
MSNSGSDDQGSLASSAREQLGRSRTDWRWGAALALFLCAFGGFLSGVSLTERPEITQSGWLTKAYYSLGLFVVGGLDIGTPIGGPLLARCLIWIAYFGAPILAASAVIEAVARILSPRPWQLRRIRHHVVIVGTGAMTDSYLRVLRRREPRRRVVVVDERIDLIRRQELQQTFNATVVTGDITHEFLITALRLHRASKVVLLGESDFQSYEAASRMLAKFPKLAGRIVLRCHNLRFMRALQETAVARQCLTFNSYQLAAAGLVRDHLIDHFHQTSERDTVVIAGFGRFGQTTLEELQAHAEREISSVALIDSDAARRLLVAEEQRRIGGSYRREILEGNISHPEVWAQLDGVMDLSVGSPTVILGTGNVEENLRAALWIKGRHPNALVFSRTTDSSQLALQVGAEHDINSFSIRQLVEDNIPVEWLG